MKRLISLHVHDGGATLRYADEHSERILGTVARVVQRAEDARDVFEVGFGPIALTYRLLVGKQVAGFDLTDLYREICELLEIPLRLVDLRKPGDFSTEKYDVVMMFEVIEHIGRPPAQICAELRQTLRPGGYLMLSTVNLKRLLNRLRLLLGLPLFADYDPPLMVRSHFREYMLDELRRYVEAAGFNSVRAEYFVADSSRMAWVNSVYRLIGKGCPSFSNFICLEAKSTNGS